MKDIPGFEGLYAITEDGKIWSHPKKRHHHGKWVSENIDSKGYYYVTFGKKHYGVHRLLALTYIQNPENKNEVNHKDGVTTNNKLENLEWCTHKENMRHAYETGLWKPYFKENKYRSSKLTESQVLEILALSKQGRSSRKIAPLYGIESSHIRSIIRGVYWKSIRRN